MGNLCSHSVEEEKSPVAPSLPANKVAEPPPPPIPPVEQPIAAQTPRSSATRPETLNPAVQSVAESAVKDMDVQLDLSSRPASSTAVAEARPPSKRRTDYKLKDLYKLGKTLGTGGFSIVKLAIERSTSIEYACKIMALPPVGQAVGENENSREDIFKEIDLLCDMNHDNVIFLKEYFEEGNKVYLITELLTGGELLDAVLKRGNYSEVEARSCFVQLLQGIAYLHSKNVTHRDLKLENLLLASPDDMTRVKIADFGLAKNAAGGMQTICGTPQYVAPEVIVGHKGHVYGPGVDMWSAGVVLYILLGGYPPFWSDSEPQLFEQIRKGRFTFDDPVWKQVSEGAKDLIRCLLVVDPRTRLTALQALQHPWVLKGLLSKDAPHLAGTQQKLITTTQKRLRARTAIHRFRHAVSIVLAMNRLAALLKVVKIGPNPSPKRIALDLALHKSMVAVAQKYDAKLQQRKAEAIRK